MSDLELLVDGKAHAGWKRIRVHRGMEEIAGSFELEVSERWSTTVPPLEVQSQQRCSVRVGSETLITGYIDRVSNGYDARSHSISVSGRDATADLVDCAAIHSKGEWKNADAGQIARDLCSPFSIKVTVAGDIGKPFPNFAIEPGETAFECMERAARQRGLRLQSDGVGGLVIGSVAAVAVNVALVEGQNLLSCEVANDSCRRFSEYLVKGQQPGTDDTNGAAAAQVRATARDAGVTRYRPSVIIDEDQGDIAGFQRRAKWEASVNAARALTANVRVQGWRHTGGLWQPNVLVRLTSPTLRIDRTLLVRDVDLVVDDAGTCAELCLTPPEAYSLLPTPEKQKAPKRKKRKAADSDADVFS